jgi:CubicO group peptidase (beta-lactamase class C family)
MRSSFLLFLGILNFTYCAGQTNKDKLLTKKLDSVFAGIFSNDKPGGSIFITQGNKTLYDKSFGLADIKTKTKFTDKTVSNLGSISKTFVAYGILILQNQGKLSVEDSITKFFPEFKNKELAGKIKIKHLLTHTSGLPDSRKVENDSIYYLTAKDYENFKPLFQTDTLEFEQGSQWKYSNPAYNGLAMIIEKVSNMKWQDFIKENIFNPSGMKNSKITDGDFPQKDVAHGYRKVAGKFEEYDYGECPTFCAAGNGGVWSSVSELKKYVSAINKCTFTDCSTIERSRKTFKPDNWKSAIEPIHSSVWFIHPDFSIRHENQTLKFQTIEHSGSQGGYRAHLILIPEKEITIIWLSNNDTFITPKIRTTLLELGYL